MTGQIAFAGTVWRAMTAGADALAPAKAPEGRFHHSGQVAIYTSLTAEGTAVAISRYLRDGDGARVVVPLTVQAERLVDLRGMSAASVVWQEDWARGIPSPTWVLSDAARTKGAQGVLYSSRSRPDLTHLVLFDLRAITAICAARPFPA